MLMRIIASLILWLASFQLLAEDINESYALSLTGEPKYAINFAHFDYVNPAAPKAGDIRLAAIGSYDSFNPYASSGIAAVYSDHLNDSLFTTSDDEIGSYYPLVADSVRYPVDYHWLEVDINPRARFQNNQPITAPDIAFSFNKFMTEGSPQFRTIYAGAQMRAISRLTVRIELPQTDKKKIFSLLTLPILPASYWRQHALNAPLSTPPVGSGPYRISDYKSGQYVVYQRISDYWAANLPVNRGRFNFDSLRYDYYPDEDAALQAFNAGRYDWRSEDSSARWADGYQAANINKGFVIKQTYPDHRPQNTRWLAFNLQRAPWQDDKVRAAISLAFDFESINKTLYNNAYQRTDSYFQNTPYAAQGYPDAAQLAILAPLKEQIPAEVYNQIYQPPHSDGSGNNSQNLAQAQLLLSQAGWQKKGQQLINAESGQPLVIHFLQHQGSEWQYLAPFQRSLQQLGISLVVDEVDNSQWEHRLRSHDFDMRPVVYPASQLTDLALAPRWGSAYAHSASNITGISDPAIDQLLTQLSQQAAGSKAIEPIAKALDRVLLWKHLMLPLWYSNQIHVAYWDKFAMPSQQPAYALGFDTWWYDLNRANSLPAVAP